MALFCILRPRGFRATPCSKIIWSGGYRGHLTKAGSIAGVKQQDLEQKFETWAKEFGKKYSSDAEKQHWFNVFQRQNLCLHRYADLAPQEYGELPGFQCKSHICTDIGPLSGSPWSDSESHPTEAGHAAEVEQQDLHQIFENWAKEYEKVYPSDAEKMFRFEIFKRNYEFVQRHNQDPTQSCTVGLNQFSDLTDEEMGEYCGDDPEAELLALMFK